MPPISSGVAPGSTSVRAPTASRQSSTTAVATTPSASAATSPSSQPFVSLEQEGNPEHETQQMSVGGGAHRGRAGICPSRASRRGAPLVYLIPFLHGPALPA